MTSFLCSSFFGFSLSVVDFI